MEQREKFGQLNQTLCLESFFYRHSVADVLKIEKFVQACLQGVRQAKLVETGYAFLAAHPVGGRWDAALDQARLLPVGQQAVFWYTGAGTNFDAT